VIQKARNRDFALEVKFTSRVTTRFQQQGVIVEAVDDNLLRLEFHSDGTRTKLFAASVVAGVPTTHIFTAIANRASLFMRVQRAGNLWTLSYSYDGVEWTVGGSFSHVMRVAAVGVYAGNSPATAHTAVIDYFLNTADSYLQ
jgi:regulation of enolase protein 1 (concanavalin A-like superfamily)